MFSDLSFEMLCWGSNSRFVSSQKTPFAAHHVKNELAEFFHECRMAPSLQSFSECQPTLEEQFDEMNNQFAGFELHMQECDKFVRSLCVDEGAE